VTLVGTAPDPATYRKLNDAPVSSVDVLVGSDHQPWTAFCEDGGATALRGGDCKRMHLVRLGGARTDETFEADSFQVRRRALYALDDHTTAPDDRLITVHRPGDPASRDATFRRPAGKAILYPNDGGDNDVFVYWVLSPETSEFEVLRRDGRYQLTLPVPAGVDPADPGATIDFLLTADGSRLALRDPNGVMTVYSTLGAGSVSLGRRPPLFAIDDEHAALLAIGSDLRSVALDGSGEIVLDPDPVDAGTFQYGLGRAFYIRDGDLYAVPLDGSAPPGRIQTQAARLYDLGPGGEVFYSRDDASRYASGAGDGLLGAARFMERGLYGGFSGDGTRVRWLEHAATVEGIGELRSARFAAGALGDPITLGLNVIHYEEIPDGPLVVAENRAEVGTWNRLVTVDEATATARWLVAGAADFLLVPGRREVIADVVTQASGYDVLQIPVP
jgi:hypothetical protein